MNIDRTSASSMLSMFEIGAALGAERDLQRFWSLFCGAARTIMRCRVVGLALHDAAGVDCHFWLVVDDRATVLSDAADFKLHGLFAQTMAGVRPTRRSLRDVDASASGLPDGHPAVSELLLAPLRLARGLAGTLYFADRDDNAAFDVADEQLVERLATQLMVSYSRFEQNEEVRRSSSETPNSTLLAERVSRMMGGDGSTAINVGIVVLDLERFTQLNDVLGRTTCDALLHQVAQRLCDSVPETWTVARIESDTFVIAAQLAEDATAVALRERVLNSFRLPFVADGRSVMLSAQIGIAVQPGDGDDFAALFKSAATALKQAKTSGERFIYYSRELTGRTAERLLLEQELRAAVDRGEFVLHYQPRVNLISGEQVGAEALIRWMHPREGVILPMQFIGLAEEIGLIVPIGLWVIDSVCTQLSRWSALGLEILPIAVNLSPLQFRQTDLLAVIAAKLRAHRIAPRMLDFEITESAVMNDSELIVDTLNGLRALGCGLALDDFGSGHSSLARLKKFPFNSVKVDRAFVTDITHNADDAAIATAILAMGHQLGLRVVAEGVETPGQLTLLRGMGCNEIQGNLFCKPLDAASFEVWLRERRRLAPSVSPSAGVAVGAQVLLIVDDDKNVRKALTRVLSRDGYRILSAGSGKEALDLLAVNPVQVIISDQQMPGMSGTAFLHVVKQLYPDTMRIILSAFTDLKVVTESVNRGSVFKFLSKPWDDELLREQVRDAFRRHQPGAMATPGS
jgi:diguanylate cyclase (GGDEF)-like protein